MLSFRLSSKQERKPLAEPVDSFLRALKSNRFRVGMSVRVRGKPRTIVGKVIDVIDDMRVVAYRHKLPLFIHVEFIDGSRGFFHPGHLKEVR